MNIASSCTWGEIYTWLKGEEQPPLLPEVFWDMMLAVYQYRIVRAEWAQLIQTLHGLAPEVNTPTFKREIVKFWLFAMFIYTTVSWQSALSPGHTIMSEQGLLERPSSSESPAKSSHCTARKQNWNRNPKWLCSTWKNKVTRKYILINKMPVHLSPLKNIKDGCTL